MQKDQSIQKGKSVIRVVAKLMIIVIAFYIAIGFLAPDKNEYTTSINVAASADELRNYFQNINHLKSKKPGIDSVVNVQKGSLPLIQWREFYGDNITSVYQGNMTGNNSFQIKTHDSNIDVLGTWDYSWEPSGDSVKVTATEQVDIQNLGFRFIMLFNDSYQELDDELLILKEDLE